MTTTIWLETKDERTRDAHREIPGMNPDGVGLEEPYQTPLGPLLYPRDPDGEPENTIMCRCTETFRISFGAGNEALDLINPAPEGGAPRRPQGEGEGSGGGSGGDGGGAGGGDGDQPRWQVTRADFDALAGRLDVPGGEAIVKAWNRHLPGLTPAAFYKGFFSGVGDLVHAKLRLNLAGKGGFEAEVFKDGESAAILERRFDLKARTFDHSAFYIEDRFQQHGMARRLLANSFAMYRELGVRSVSIQARNVGAYSWSNIGFVPTPESWRALQSAAIERLEKVKGSLEPEAVQRAVMVLTSPDPKRLWDMKGLHGKVESAALGKYLLLGQKWDGALDFTDAESLAVFTSYLRKR